MSTERATDCVAVVRSPLTSLSLRKLSLRCKCVGAGRTVCSALSQEADANPPTLSLRSTLGQPLEVLKTHQAANRTDSLRTAIKKTYARGGVKGFYQVRVENTQYGAKPRA